MPTQRKTKPPTQKKKQTNHCVCGSEVQDLSARLEECQRVLRFQSEELKAFKEVSAFFLGKYIENIDNIQPEDLEFGLIRYQDSADSHSSSSVLSEEQKAEAWDKLVELCKNLGMDDNVPSDKFSISQQVKIFVKAAIRDKASIKNRLEALESELQQHSSRLGEDVLDVSVDTYNTSVGDDSSDSVVA